MPPHLDPILLFASVRLISPEPLLHPDFFAYPAKLGLHPTNWFHFLHSPRLLHPSSSDPAMSNIRYSVVVPAFRENGNLRPLVTRIFGALSQVNSPVPAQEVEVIVVDDNSRDGSVETVDQLQREGYNVRIIVRTTERGLSSAVVRGFREAQGDNMLCMDADLQVCLLR